MARKWRLSKFWVTFIVVTGATFMVIGIVHRDVALAIVGAVYVPGGVLAEACYQWWKSRRPRRDPVRRV